MNRPAAQPDLAGSSSAPAVCAVVVTFHPDADVLREQIAALAGQVAAVVVVDNSPPEAGVREVVPAGVAVLAQDGNGGLARAQNAGIAWARGQGCTHVLVLDQDSVPDPGMVDALCAELARLQERERVGAVGPRFRDARTGRAAPFIEVAFPMSRKLWCAPGQTSVAADFLISSGALIPLAVLDDVGGMDDALFIDNVDMEWSFRARARGYRLFGVCDATMEHRLGDAHTRVLGGRAEIVTHGPVRLYFIMRNRVALYRLPHTPRVWIAQDLPRVLAKFLIFTVLVGPRPRNARYMLHGLLDGLRGRLGPCHVPGGAA